MRVKFNRGPLKNKYYDIENGTRDYLVQVAQPITLDVLSNRDMDPFAPIAKRGTYHRSNVTQKNGAVVFEWMGWME